MKKENWISLIMTCMGFATGMGLGGLILNERKTLLEIIISAILGAVFTFIFRWIIDSISKKKN